MLHIKACAAKTLVPSCARCRQLIYCKPDRANEWMAAFECEKCVAHLPSDLVETPLQDKFKQQINNHDLAIEFHSNKKKEKANQENKK